MAQSSDGGPSADEQYRAALQVLASPSFSLAPATEKQTILWDFVSRYPYGDERRPPLNTTIFQLMIRLINRGNLRKAFDVDIDVRPPRTKAFHPCGTMAKIRFVIDGQHPFTGLFATGAVGLARMSLAMGEQNYGPSGAFKFLIDGAHRSENLLLDQSLDTQTSRDFFERAPTNLTLKPSTYPLKLVFPLLDWWLSAISNPMFQSLEHLAAVNCDGTTADPVVAPQLVFLYGPAPLHPDPATTRDFRDILKAIPSGTTLYRIFGRMNETADQIYIGSLQTESPFVASEFGDRIVSLRHTRS